MKIQDITAHMGITAAALADLMGVSKQALNNYTSGRKGKASKFTADLYAVAGLEIEEVIFPDAFDSALQEPWHRHLNAAIECLEMAAHTGADRERVDSLKKAVLDFGSETIPEHYPDMEI